MVLGRRRREEAQTCDLCGRRADDHDRHVRFSLPDPVLELPDLDDTDGVWTSDPDPHRAVMMQVPDLGGFVRALLPVRLTRGYTVTFGVWVGVHPDDLRRAFDLWWDEKYPTLTLSGRLANAVPGWGLLAAPVDLAVVDPAATPYCVASTNTELAKVLTEEWDHEPVLSQLPA